jgi:5-methylcytosine-specific restriction protein A
MPKRPKSYRPNTGTGKKYTPPHMKRPTSVQRGQDRAWRKLSASHLASSPLCVLCEERGRTTAATQVDHIIAHKGDDSLRLDGDNLRSLCQSCHSRKTATVDSGFGRPPKPTT